MSPQLSDCEVIQNIIFLLLLVIIIVYNVFIISSTAISCLFQMRLDNIKLCLNEDRPSGNITSPGPVPINLEVSELIVSRGPDGIFHIEPPGDLYVNSIVTLLCLRSINSS